MAEFVPSPNRNPKPLKHGGTEEAEGPGDWRAGAAENPTADPRQAGTGRQKSKFKPKTFETQRNGGSGGNEEAVRLQLFS
jgi:hypothetical protein